MQQTIGDYQGVCVVFFLLWPFLCREKGHTVGSHTHTQHRASSSFVCVKRVTVSWETLLRFSMMALSLSPTALGIKRRHRCFIFILLVAFVFPTSSSLLIFVSCAFVRIMKWNWEKNAQLIPPTPSSSYINAPPLCSSVKSQNRGSSTFLGLIWDDDDDDDDDRFPYPHSF